jgi:hypothetical protein
MEATSLGIHLSRFIEEWRAQHEQERGEETAENMTRGHAYQEEQKLGERTDVRLAVAWKAVRTPWWSALSSLVGVRFQDQIPFRDKRLASDLAPLQN